MPCSVGPTAFASEAAAIATAYTQVDRMKARYNEKTVLVGNPVQEAIAKLGEAPFPQFDEYAVQDSRHRREPGRDGPEQGRARRPGPVVALACLRLQVMQQCRPDDIAHEVRTKYAQLGIPAELMTYIEDMLGKLGEAHLVIARSGASTVAELTAAGRPAILIPYPKRRTITRPRTRATSPKPAEPA